jgi:leucyl aminopeptidase
MPSLPLAPLQLPRVEVTDDLEATLADLPDGATCLLAVSATDLAPARAVGLDPQQVSVTHEPGTATAAVTLVPLPPGRGVRAVALVGLGSGTDADLRTAGAALGRAAQGKDILVVALPRGSSHATRALVEGIVLGGFVGPAFARSPRRAQVRGVILVGHDLAAAHVGARHAQACAVARALGSMPSNVKTPAWLAAEAEAAAHSAGLSVRVWTESDLHDEGFGGLLAVGGGSAHPPRFVQLDYVPVEQPPVARAKGRRRSANPRHVVLVGKGITFDSGGLDIKPAAGMLAMKTDMAGAAAVIAVLGACRDLGVTVRVTGLLAIAENSVSGSSYRPGDVVTQYGGTTVEIGNTDAEGRIVLADALAYADAHLDPDVVIDIATLTGAATVALGRALGPLFASDDDLREALLQAGRAAGEPMWPFPLVEEYRPWLDSSMADLSHIAHGAPGGGAIVGALFLREFTGGRRWAHLDIAGPGRSEKDVGLVQEGATGYGARLLLRYLEALSR